MHMLGTLSRKSLPAARRLCELAGADPGRLDRCALELCPATWTAQRVERRGRAAYEQADLVSFGLVHRRRDVAVLVDVIRSPEEETSASDSDEAGTLVSWGPGQGVSYVFSLLGEEDGQALDPEFWRPITDRGREHLAWAGHPSVGAAWQAWVEGRARVAMRCSVCKRYRVARGGGKQYPRQVCGECDSRAVDARGRPVRGYAGDHEHVEVWIDGIPCLRYHLFGGWITMREHRALGRRR